MNASLTHPNRGLIAFYVTRQVVVAAKIRYRLEPCTSILPAKEPAEVNDRFLHFQLDSYVHPVLATTIHMMTAKALFLSPEHYYLAWYFAGRWHVGLDDNRRVDQVVEDADK